MRKATRCKPPTPRPRNIEMPSDLHSRVVEIAFAIVAMAIIAGSFWPTSAGGGGTYPLHLISYGSLGLLAGAHLRRSRSTGLLLVGCLLGVAIELLQPFFGREGDVADVYANLAGLGLGWLVGFALVVVSRLRS